MSLHDSCWIWTGGVNNSGYGPHRRTYEAHRGAVPRGLELDHLCRIRRCLNPAHMEPVTKRENILRSDSPASIHASKLHCPQGHPYDGFNVRGERICLTCARPRIRDAYRKRRARLGLTVGLSNKDRQTCKRGHPLSEPDARGHRHCRECHRLREAARRANSFRHGGAA